MSVFSYHLVKVSNVSALRTIFFPQKMKKIPDLIHAEMMSAMTLGAPIFAPSRILFRQIVVFAQWKNETAIDNFLKEHQFGKILQKGWHIRLHFLRQWGTIKGFQIPINTKNIEPSNSSVIAVTIARMRLTQVPRFINWGRPVEKLVRDNPNAILSLASIRLPRTVSTFSIWKSVKDMTDMVHGHNNVPQPKRHHDAMQERNRKDFHFEFTTLRFQPIAEYGTWNGRDNWLSK